jgi:perosamine synthetase
MHIVPAKSEFKLYKIFDSKSEDKVNDYFNNQAVFMNSWVGILALTLEKLKNEHKKNKVVLARHSCYEFTKAIFISGLEPIYVDIDQNLTMSLDDVNDLVKHNNDDILAIISVNNCGVENNNLLVKNICIDNNIIFIEDATYTFLGKGNNYNFGYIGDISILNFSEGKFIPVGGGAVLFNNMNLQNALSNIKRQVLECEKESNTKELVNIVKYKVGSSSLVYTLYKYFLRVSKLDLKKIYSMEPTRDDKKLKSILLNMKRLNKIKFSVINDILVNSDDYNRVRKDNSIYYKSLLTEKDNINFLELPDKGVCIKQPILCKYGVDEEKLLTHESLGIKKLYSEHSDLYGNQKFPISNLVYGNLITLPVHKDIDKNTINKIIQALDEICR